MIGSLNCKCEGRRGQIKLGNRIQLWSENTLQFDGMITEVSQIAKELITVRAYEYVQILNNRLILNGSTTPGIKTYTDDTLHDIIDDILTHINTDDDTYISINNCSNRPILNQTVSKFDISWLTAGAVVLENLPGLLDLDWKLVRYTNTSYILDMDSVLYRGSEDNPIKILTDNDIISLTDISTLESYGNKYVVVGSDPTIYSIVNTSRTHTERHVLLPNLQLGDSASTELLADTISELPVPREIDIQIPPNYGLDIYDYVRVIMDDYDLDMIGRIMKLSRDEGPSTNTMTVSIQNRTIDDLVNKLTKMKGDIRVLSVK